MLVLGGGRSVQKWLDFFRHFGSTRDGVLGPRRSEPSPRQAPEKRNTSTMEKNWMTKSANAKFQVKIEKFFCITRSFLWDRDPTELMMFNSRNKCEQNLLVGGMISLVGTINKLQGQGRKL